MVNYECMYIVRPDVEEEVLNSTRDKVLSAIGENGGELLESKDLGKRRLAYEIDDFREGIYTLLTFTGKAGIITELDRVMNISDTVIRHLTVNIDKK